MFEVQSLPPRLAGPRNLAALHRDVWRLMRVHPWLFVGFPAVAHLPFDVLSELLASEAGEDTLRAVQIGMRFQGLVDLVWGTFVVATLLQGLTIVGEGRTPTLWEAMGRARETWGRVVVTTFVVRTLTVLSAFIFVVPALYLASRWMLAIPAAAIDGMTSSAARKKSWELVRNRGALRVLIYGASMLIAYSSFCLAAAVVLPSVEGFAGVLLEALKQAPINVTLAGLTLGTGILYLELLGREVLYPVGLALENAEGRRADPPNSTGTTGLVVVGTVASLTLVVGIPVAVFGIWVLLDETAALAALEQIPWLLSVFAWLGS
ncbi:MAG: glycerophosphoryl diester phosphodiesterase membrane domain-containing protein [Deltaproteobacteria bacterium]|nr:glycerophosphoryl diester phosphodiesterase membrane domain-containing protein [Deltaproteobacteria bacterium]